MKKLRIFFVTTELPSRGGGANVRNFNLIKYLNKKKFSASLFTITKAQTKQELNLIQKELNIHIYTVPYRNLSLFGKISSLIKRTLPYMKEHSSSGLSNLILEKLKKEKPDLIQLEQITAYYAIKDIIPYLKKNNIKIILDQHNVEYIALTEGIRSFSLPKKIIGKIILPSFKKLEYKALRDADHVFFCSKIDRKQLKSIINFKKSSIVPNGVDTKYFVPNNVKEKKSLIFMGSTSYPPNNEALQFYLTKIHPKVKEDITDIVIYIIGANPPKWLKKIAEKDRSIIITGHVPDVRTYLSKANIGICPIKSGSGTRLKILEYLATGKAVVSTRKGAEGIEVINGENILLSEKDNAFAENIISLCKDRKKAKSLQENARKLILSKYQWDNIIKEMEENYLRIK